MKLSDLVAFRNQIDALNTSAGQQATNLDIDKIFYLIRSQPTKFKDFENNLVQTRQNLQSCFDQFENYLTELKEEITSQIQTIEPGWFQESYRLYEEEMVYETTEYILNRRPDVSEQAMMFYKARIKKYSDWKYPGMIIRPGIENFIEDMVSNDPLYVLDQSHDLLQPSIEKFPEQYQKRLRAYVIKETLDEEILSKIPNGQFGFCLMYNFLNFRPFEIIKKYLTEIYIKLRPGGTLIITFNDCDNHKAVKLVEQHFCCYTPGYLIKELANGIGYEQLLFWNDNGPSSWLELRKPGQLDSLKGGQTLAKILSK